MSKGNHEGSERRYQGFLNVSRVPVTYLLFITTWETVWHDPISHDCVEASVQVELQWLNILFIQQQALRKLVEIMSMLAAHSFKIYRSNHQAFVLGPGEVQRTSPP